MALMGQIDVTDTEGLKRLCDLIWEALEAPAGKARQGLLRSLLRVNEHSEAVLCGILLAALTALTVVVKMRSVVEATKPASEKPS
jgi:hypothetical protein